jgi:transposase
MSLQEQAIPDIPPETRRVARAIFPKGNVYMKMREALGTLYRDQDFADLFPPDGQPALAPWRLALVCLMQFAENLTDRQAADAVRTRIDWKYALSLELTDPGFDFSVLSEFRDRLLAGNAETRLLDVMLTTFKARGWLKAGGRQRTDATYVKAAIHRLNRVELVAAVFQEALEALAIAAPDWLRARTPADWFIRYSPKLNDYRLPRKETEQLRLAQQIGQDGQQVLQWVEAADAPGDLRHLEAIGNLRLVWGQQYDVSSTPPRWLDHKELLDSADREASPHDTEARFQVKNEVSWVGYQAHFTETCDEDSPHFIIQVETTPATTSDYNVLPDIHADLQQQAMLPTEHLVDGGYSSSHLLNNSQVNFGVTVICPARPDASWQAHTPGAYTVDTFQIDWAAQTVTCPQGAHSQFWRTRPAPKSPRKTVATVTFAETDCAACPARVLCTRGQGPRTLTLLPEPEFVALKQARQREKTPEFAVLYAKRSGIEGTISQVTQRTDAHQARYIGLAKTHLQQIFSATAVNLARAINWLNGVPRAQTRRSRFARLAA